MPTYISGWIFLCFMATSLLGNSQTMKEDEATTDASHSDSLKRIVIVDNILITGNKKTKDVIILRELDVKPGEKYAYADLLKLLSLDRNKIYNTSLFNEVDVQTYDLSEDRVIIQVDVKERWYLYPIPKIDFVDRNLNDWIQNHGADWSRVNWGIKFTQYNFRGRNERLALLLQGGYTKQAGIQYAIPYIDKNQRTGIAFRLDYAENTNTAFNTIDHDRKFVDSDEIIRRQTNAGVSITRRNSFYNSHHFGLDYSNTWVGDTVLTLNPNYFRDGVNQQRFFVFGYSYNSDHRDIIAYPLTGYRFKISAIKKGLGVFDDINTFQVSSSYTKYWELKKRYFISNNISAYASFPENQDYANSTGLGFGNEIVRGYELWVIEGRSYFLNKTTFKKELLNIKKNINAIPLEQFQTFPLAIYLKTFFDFGYVNNLVGWDTISSRLTNKVIWGTGVGLDFFTAYDMVIRIEYAMNSEFQDGFFVHFKKEF